MPTNHNWTGTEWQEHVNLLLLRRYGPGDYQCIPDRHGGDLGLEGFSASDGCAYQCYAAAAPYTSSELYEKQRDKLSADTGKFIANSAGFVEIFGDVRIRKWILVVPEFDNRRLVAHATRRASIIREATLPFVADDFRVAVVTDDAFAAERAALFAAGAMPFTATSAPLSDEMVDAWVRTEADSTLVANLVRKIEGKAAHGKIHELRRELLRQYLLGQKVLTDLRARFPEEWVRVTTSKRARESQLIVEVASGESAGALKTHIEAYREDLGRSVKGISDTDTLTLAHEAIVDWLMRCPLDFPASSGPIS